MKILNRDLRVAIVGLGKMGLLHASIPNVLPNVQLAAMCEKPVYKPLHANLSGSSCPNVDKVYEQGLSIPLYPSLSEVEIEYLLQRFDVLFAGCAW